MSKEKCVNKKLHPYFKTGIYGWFGEEVDDNDYMICPICGEVLGMNYWEYQAENNGDNKCPECGQELDYSEIYDFEETLYFRQLLEIKKIKFTDLEAKLAEKEKKIEDLQNFIALEAIKEIKELKAYGDFCKYQIAIEELEKVNSILTDTIIEVTENEFDLNKLCYLEEISAKFGDKINKQIALLKGEK